MANTTKDNSGINVPKWEYNTPISKAELDKRNQGLLNLAYEIPIRFGVLSACCFLHNTGTSTILPNTDKSGSVLKFASATSYSSVYNVTGTWRCMGYCPANQASLFVRVL